MSKKEQQMSETNSIQPSSIQTKRIIKKTLNEVMKLDGVEFIDKMEDISLELGKQIEKIDTKKNELAAAIKKSYEERLKFIEFAWNDGILTPEEKRKIYNDYLETSIELNEYLQNEKMSYDEKAKKKEKFMNVTMGTRIASYAIMAVSTAALAIWKIIRENK